MDTSERYIKMCYKSIELQIDHKFDDHDFVHYENLRYIENIGSCWDGKIWLPRQDQLQEMIEGDINKKIYKFNSFICLPSVISVNNIDSEKVKELKQLWENQECLSQLILIEREPEWEFVQPLDYSFEQIWLMLVMKEKHNKTWSRKKQDWIAL